MFSTYRVVGAIACVGIVGYIAFGGIFSQPKKKKKKSPSVTGLANIGNSCFLNALVQSLASCPVFCHWIAKNAKQSSSPKLLESLHNLLSVVNKEEGEVSTERCVGDVMRSLRTHGWVISSEEQDAHELFHALASTLEDEITSLKSAISLLDVSWLASATNKDYSVESNQLVKDKNKMSSICSSSAPRDISLRSNCDGSLASWESKLSNNLNDNELSILNKYNIQIKSLTNEILNDSSDLPLQMKINKEALKSPFKGHLANFLQCKICNKKRPGQWSSFESLSLYLPTKVSSETTLLKLLDEYVSPEEVSDVKCDTCSRRAGKSTNTTFSKQHTIGKLPQCLCFHIQRTTWLNNGMAQKRHDFVSFPVHLNMEPYTYTRSVCERSPPGLVGGRDRSLFEDQLKKSTNNNNSDEQNSVQIDNTFTSSSGPSSVWTTLQSLPIYKLQAIVVHVGDILSGHFITYRKGPSSMNNRWFYCSDLSVKEVPFETVQQANIYMIIYERVHI